MTRPAGAPAFRDRFDRPVFIVNTPRSGSTMLFEALARAPDLYTIGGESHQVIESVPGLSPADRGWTSNRLTAADATPDQMEMLARGFYEQLRDRAGQRPAGPVRMLEKTPKNALRVSFLDVAFPDAIFVYLYRDVRETISSMLEAWLSGAFRTYPQLPGWRGYPWSLLLIPGWQSLNGLPLHQIVAHQWATTTETLLDDLSTIPRDRLRGVTYRALVASPQATIQELAQSTGLGWDQEIGSQLPLSKTTVSEPHADKWRTIAPVIDQIRPIVESANTRAIAFAESLRPAVPVN